jgi:hypothetical protein
MGILEEYVDKLIDAGRRWAGTDRHACGKFHTLPPARTIDETFMIKAISIALIAGGVVLLYFGGQSFHSFANDVSRAFTGAPTNKTIWLIAGGVVATLAGIVGLTASFGKR